MPSANPTPHPLDAAARDELARKAEAARDTMAYAACRVLDGEMDHEANAIASRAQGEFLHAVSSPDVILALLASVRGAEADTARLDFLAANPNRIGWATGYLRSPGTWTYTDEQHAVIPCESLRAALDAARAHPPTQETDADAE